MSGHNKGADIQRRVDYFKQLRNQSVQAKKPERQAFPKQQFTFPKFVTTPRRPGARGK